MKIKHITEGQVNEISANPDYLRAAERSLSQARDTQRQYWKSPEEKAAARRTELKREKGIGGYTKRHRAANPEMYPKVEPRPAPKLRDPSTEYSDDYSTWAKGRRDTMEQGVAEDAGRAEAQAAYMQGECMILAIAINQLNPKRYPIGYIWEYNTSAGAPDVQLDDDEWNTLSPEEQEEISKDISRHSVVHAYVRDQETGEYIDARGRHKTLPNLWGRLGKTRFEEFPGTARELIDITAHGDWDEVGEQVSFKRGQPAFDSLAGPAGVKRAQEYAVKYLGVEGNKNKLRIGNIVRAVVDGKRVQGEVIGISSDHKEVELWLSGVNDFNPITVNARDIEPVSEQGVVEGSENLRAKLDLYNEKAFEAGHRHDDQAWRKYTKLAKQIADQLGLKYKVTGYGLEILEQGVAEVKVTKKDIEASKKKIDASRKELEKQGVKKSELGEPNYYLDAELRKAKKKGVAEGRLEEVDRRGFLKGLGAAALGAAGVGAATTAQARATPEWMQLYGKAKSKFESGYDVAQVARALGVSGPNNNMVGPMGGEWGAINKAAQDTGTRNRDDVPSTQPSRPAAPQKQNTARDEYYRVRGEADNFSYRNPEFRQEYLRIVDIRDRAMSKILNGSRTYSNDPDLAKRQHQEIIKLTNQLDAEFVQKTNLLLKQYGALREQGVEEGDISQLEKDIADAPVKPIANMEGKDEKIGGRHDPDEFDAMVSRLKKLAGSGPMKTVYDPSTRRYKNMPTAVQPPAQPKK